ncbi:putative beta-lysine N-acetyltransferase [Metabacillus sp. RGM 3146]|uniref:putative beta-lysine N-acetyltransferase n=1 Tax=Metabacillus sp. RGM 3146 TaxID=3401092 RepID=UPI003B9C5ED6
MEIVHFKNSRFHAEIGLDHFNKRTKLEDYHGDLNSLIDELMVITKKAGFSKIILKAKHPDIAIALANAYQLEGVIDGYFKGSDAYLFSRFLTEERCYTSEWIKEDAVLDALKSLKVTNVVQWDLEEVVIRKAEGKDASRLAELYNAIFQVYPTPVSDSEYLAKSIKSGNVFYVAEIKDRIISAASAEINEALCNAEITDCATMPEYRRHKFIQILIGKIAQELKQRGIFQVYSLARARSFGMNAALYNSGYQYKGRLLNNCYIFKSLENMNVWCKKLC